MLIQETGILFGLQRLDILWEKIFESIVFKSEFADTPF